MMIKYFNTLTNTRGDSLSGYRAQVTNASGVVQDIFADSGGTRFTDGSGGVVNYATADANGIVEFYFTPDTGQILQTLDQSGSLVRSVTDFADQFVLANLSGPIEQADVTDLVSDQAAQDALITAKANSTDLAASGGAGLIGTVFGGLASLIALILGGRTLASATFAAAMPNGTIFTMGGRAYQVDSSAVGTDSCTDDLGVDGIVPFGIFTPYHFGAAGDGSDDSAAMTAWCARLNSSATAIGSLDVGIFAFGTTLSLTTASRRISGAPGGWKTGSTEVKTVLRWNGGAAPMFDTGTTRHYFTDFDVEGNGSATDFLEMNTGSQAVYVERVFFQDNLFTRSCFRSNGNRIGYSRFTQVSATLSAPKFIDIDGQGTANAITPFYFVDCQFAGSGSGGTTPWTIVHIKDETVEQIGFERCTLISRGGLVVIDTTDTPAATTADSIYLHACEIDNVEGSAFRMFKLENVRQFSMTDCVATGDGTPLYLAECVNSNVSEFRGNFWKSIGRIFDLDSNSKISGVGVNYPDWSGTDGVWLGSVASANIHQFNSASAVVINTENFITEKHEVVEISVTSGSGYSIRLGTTKPYFVAPGQIFTVVVKNTSGGAISAPSFFASQFNTQGSTTAPANGFNRSYTFYFNGTKAIELYRTGADVAN